MVNDHSVLRGLVLDGNRSPVATTQPLILARSDREFIPGLLKDLTTSAAAFAASRPPAGSSNGGSSPAVRDLMEGLAFPRIAFTGSQGLTRDSNNVLKLFQPVHQIFHIAILQIDCDSFGAPRLDPKKIDSMGLVVRRVSANSPSLTERWSKQDTTIAGWVPCDDEDLDPDPARRLPRATSGNAIIDQRLSLPSPAYAPYSESVTPVFAAPPDLCKALKATVLYGLIPVTSVEKSEAIPAPSYDPAIVQQHMPYFLQLSSSLRQSQSLPFPNFLVFYTSATDTYTVSDPNTDQSTVPDRLAPFLTILRQFEFELNLFGDTPDAQALFQALNQFTVQDGDGNDLANLGDFLKSAAQVLVDKQEGWVQMPAQWPAITDDQSVEFAGLIQKAMEARAKELVSGEARYEITDPPRQYRLRAFVRVKRPDGCPPALVWSDLSEKFTIAPWYDHAGLPPIRIQLPKFDRDSIKNLKPNVAFSMPEDLFNQLQRDGKKIMKGESTQKGGSSLGIDWICGFNIPVITICAFIVLNIFLSLFDLFLHWLLFIKICIPIPKKN